MSSTFVQYKNMTPDQLLDAARARFYSALQLLKIEGCDQDAVYLAGYALEFILKRHIALRLGWEKYPPEYKEINECVGKPDTDNKTFKTHDINKLATIAGIKNDIMADSDLASHWLLALKWQVEIRYSPSGYLQDGAKETVDSIRHVIKFIIGKHE